MSDWDLVEAERRGRADLAPCCHRSKGTRRCVTSGGCVMLWPMSWPCRWRGRAVGVAVPSGSAGRVLAVVLVHTQDVRRPLGLPRDVPEDRLRVALEASKANRFIGNTKRIAGLHLFAIAIDWKWGDGVAIPQHRERR